MLATLFESAGLRKHEEFRCDRKSTKRVESEAGIDVMRQDYKAFQFEHRDLQCTRTGRAFDAGSELT